MMGESMITSSRQENLFVPQIGSWMSLNGFNSATGCLAWLPKKVGCLVLRCWSSRAVTLARYI